MSEHYILDGHVPVNVDLMTWALWSENIENRRVGLTTFDSGGYVSTVFLGLDYSFGNGPPLLFETMIFGGPESEYCERYSTWDEAEAGHLKAVALATMGASPAADAVDPRVADPGTPSPRAD